MKEDILEQLVEEYLQHQGYFTRHNDKFRPDPRHADHVTASDAVNSDIDILALHPGKRGAERVMVVTCKSWQSGFDAAWWLTAIREKKSRSGREVWKNFRELTVAKWAEAFRRRVAELAGTESFTYALAVTKLKGDRDLWEQHGPFREMLGGNPIRILTVKEMLEEIVPTVGTTPAATEIGRLIQIIKASGTKLGEA